MLKLTALLKQNTAKFIHVIKWPFTLDDSLFPSLSSLCEATLHTLTSLPDSERRLPSWLVAVYVQSCVSGVLAKGCCPPSPVPSAPHQHPPSSPAWIWLSIPRPFPNLAVLQTIILVRVVNKMPVASSLWVSNLLNENTSEVIIKNSVLHISNTVKYLGVTY